MLYTETFAIPEGGVHRIGAIGGQPMVKKVDSRGCELEFQLGFKIPPRIGVLHIDPLLVEPRVFDTRVSVYSYNNRPITDVKVPSRITTELPCSVTVTGEVGVYLQVIAWEVFSEFTRGASESFFSDGAPVSGDVPPWASSFDFAAIAAVDSLEFFDSSGSSVGMVNGRLVYTMFSIPDRAATFTLTGAAGSLLVFRQQG